MVNGFPNDTPDLCVEPHLSSRSPASGRKLLEALDTAMERGRRALLAEQRDDGSCEDRTDLGPVGPAMHWIVERQFDVLSTEDAEAARRYLLSQQRPDGSFPAFPGALEG